MVTAACVRGPATAWSGWTGPARCAPNPSRPRGAADRLGVPADRLPESVWWLDDSGQVFAAAEAMNAALSVALGSRAPLRLYRLPGMRRLQERVYRWVATHRYRFPGTTPYCESHPAGCAAS